MLQLFFSLSLRSFSLYIYVHLPLSKYIYFVNLLSRFCFVLCFAAIKHHYETQVSVSQLLYGHLSGRKPLALCDVTLEKELLFMIVIIHAVIYH